MRKSNFIKGFSVLLLVTLLCWTTPVLSQPIKSRYQGFFTRDIFLFSGTPFSSPPLPTVLPVSQRFRSACANMNRFILAFDVKDEKPSGRLVFRLFRREFPKNPIHQEIIDTRAFPPPQKMGSHFLKGIFHTIWIPAQKNSKNLEYFWTLSKASNLISKKLGLYLTNHHSQQVSLLVGSSLPSARAAFYTFCRYQFDWEKVVSKIGHRLKKETGFLTTFLILVIGNIFWIFRAEPRP